VPLAGSSHCAARASQAGGPSSAETEWKLLTMQQTTTTHCLVSKLNAENDKVYLLHTIVTGNS
jgi:hypothetical protein